jgi:hypothetical protein
MRRLQGDVLVAVAPLRPPEPLEPTIGSHMRGIGGPEKQWVDSAAALKRDAADAAEDYRKPGRSGRR